MRILFAGETGGSTATADMLGDVERLAAALVAAGAEASLLVGAVPESGERITRSAGDGISRFTSATLDRDLPVLAAVLQSDIVVAFGSHPAALAGLALSAGVPACAWYGSTDLAETAEREPDRRVGLLASDPVTRAVIATLLARPVGQLSPPLPQIDLGTSNGTAVIVPGLRAAEGAELALALARDRPDVQFIWLASSASPHQISAFARRLPANGGIDQSHDRASAPAGRLVLAPAGRVGPLVSLLAVQIDRGASVLHGDADELRALLATPGLSLTAPVSAWLAALDHGLRTRPSHHGRAVTARPSPDVAAAQGLQALNAHIAAVRQFAAGRI